MRISDWSSDVCSSDLAEDEERPHRPEVAVCLVLELSQCPFGVPQVPSAREEAERIGDQVELGVGHQETRGLDEGQAKEEQAASCHTHPEPGGQIGRASCRERVCQ